ncbi:hypothetical protein PybrP1_006309 [[Pythium] brassicae (nom. inval.)]|nr:hypothetical protein PybrP1_006309 [[Pythium] brassicae (nom. inval.)]
MTHQRATTAKAADADVTATAPSENQRLSPPPSSRHADADPADSEALAAAVRVALKSVDSFPEEEESYVGEDGVVVTAPADDRTRARKLKRLLAEREREVRQAAEYGMGLLDKNEELQLQLAALQIHAEAEADALARERDAFKRHHDHALLEVESWKRRFARVEEDKYELVRDFERFAAQCACRVGSDSSDRVAELTHQVAELELALAHAQASEQAGALTIAQLRAWKRAAEHQQKESHELELLEMQRDRTLLDKLAGEHAKLQTRAAQLAAANEQLSAHADTCALELRAKKKEAQALLDELAESRLECSAKAELLLTAEARSSRLQRELALLEDVSYLSRAVIDHDTEEDEDSDEDVVDHSRATSETKLAAVAESGDGTDANDADADADAAEPRPSLDGVMPSPFAAFPAAVRAANGKPVAPTASDLESHKKLHHYFHLTAQSIIHENKLHDKCFRSSSRFTIDSWYREIIALDIPYLEWHAWLINRISEVAASVQLDEDPALLSPASAAAGRATGAAGRHPPRHVSGFFLRKDPESSSPVGVSAESSPSSHRQRQHVPFSVARAFFRFLRGRREPELDSSSEE